MKKLKVSIIQSTVKPYAVESNLEQLAKKLELLAQKGIKLSLLPEFFSTGNTLEPRLLETAIKYSSLTREWIGDQSKKLDMIISGTYLHLQEEDVYNTFFIQEPNKDIKYHYKTEDPGPEKMYYKAADRDDHIIETSLGKIGTIICSESFSSKIIFSDLSECALILIVFSI